MATASISNPADWNTKGRPVDPLAGRSAYSAAMDSYARQVGLEFTKHDPGLWFENYAKIAVKAAGVSGEFIARKRLNEYQRKITDIVKWATENQRPCRIVALKPRQKGSSTISVGIGYHFLANNPKHQGLIAGGSKDQTKSMRKILKTYADNDELGPRCRCRGEYAYFDNGAQMDNVTLATPNAGRGSTYQFLLVTEVALLAKDGVANDRDQLDGLLKTVGQQSGTIIILESTAFGASGMFYEKYRDGITFEEFKAGREGYVKVFSPWFEFEDSQMDPIKQGITSEADYDDEEEELAELWNLNMRQVAWRRWAVRDECANDPELFGQDYPFDDVSCFLKTGKCIFPAGKLAYQKRMLENARDEGGPGNIDWREDIGRARFTPCDRSTATIIVFEKPKRGCRYILALDVAKGDEETSGEDPDSHSIQVWRDGFYDAETKEWVPPKLVARNMMQEYRKKRLICWWPAHVVEEVTYTLAQYYGNCLIVPEINYDPGIVEKLRMRRRINLYMRREWNKRSEEFTNYYGWKTDPKSKPRIIEALVTLIRQSGEPGQGVLLRCPWLLDQCGNFIRKPDGSTEAAHGHHDDDVMAAAIALYNIGQATPYYDRPEVARDEPDAQERRRRYGSEEVPLGWQNT